MDTHLSKRNLSKLIINQASVCQCVPDEVEVLQCAGHLLTFLLQVLRTELGLGGVSNPTTLLPQEL